MQANAALSLVELWLRAYGTDRAAMQGSAHTLHAELIGLVPDCATGSVATVNDVPTVITVDETNAMLAVAADAVDEGDDQVTWRFKCVARFPRGTHSRIILNDEIRASNNGTRRHRTWEFLLASGEALTIHGSESLRGGFPAERQPDSDELSARKIARAFGWHLPEPDASPAEYQ
jgi:hypothetical protein